MRGDTTHREERIRHRAHELWERAGSPPGRDDEFWQQAEAEIDMQDRDQRPDPPSVPRR